MTRYILSSDAKADITNIWKYTNKRWGKKQAEHYISELRQRMLWLVKNPDLGLKRDEIKPGYRSFTEGKHVIFYRVTSSRIEVIGIPHQSMDVERQLGNDQQKLTHEGPDLDT